MEYVTTREPVNKLLTHQEWQAWQERLAKSRERATPEPIPPKKYQLPAFYEAEVKRIELKQRSIPEAVHQRDIHDLITAKACLQFPNLTPVAAYAKFLNTKEGLDLMRQYNEAPPAPDVPEEQPQMPSVGRAMAKMDRLATELVEKGEVRNHAHGIVEVLKRDPTLYTDYLDEIAGS